MKVRIKAMIAKDLRPEQWDRCQELLRKVVDEHCDNTVEGTVRDFVHKETLWLDINDLEALAVIRDQDRGRRRVLVIEFLAGTGMWGWIKDLEDYCKRFAKLIKCDKLEFVTRRKGWEGMERRFPEYTMDYVVWRRDI